MESDAKTAKTSSSSMGTVTSGSGDKGAIRVEGETFANGASSVKEIRSSATCVNTPSGSATDESYSEGLQKSNAFDMNSAQRKGIESRFTSLKSVKDIIEESKNLYRCTDELHEQIDKIFHNFADTILKSVFLFDPTTVQIMSDENTAIGGLPSPQEVHFTRQAVSDSYIDLSQVISQRPESESEFSKEGVNRLY